MTDTLLRQRTERYSQRWLQWSTHGSVRDPMWEQIGLFVPGGGSGRNYNNMHIEFPLLASFELRHINSQSIAGCKTRQFS